ncbi:hypothetical protein C1886_06665 [Pseudomonas sp. FW300-N1A1]|nr:hypothetical protein C1886_06665 [Pseudomonas sp. FW300-N1A1]
MLRRSYPDILLLIARDRASPNASKNVHLTIAPCGFRIGAFSCALWQPVSTGHPCTVGMH